MSPIQSQQVSPRRIAANRRKALRSTGPRSAEGKRRSSLNAVKRGLCTDSFQQAMLSLGEDPREFDRLHRDLVGSLQPANALEAKLWWKKARAERGQAGVQIQQVERLQLERLREFHEVNCLSMDQPRDEVAEVGLLRAKNCTGKFKTALGFLDMLIARIERGKGYDDAEEALQALFGPKPTWRGSLILDYFRRLKEGEEFLPEDQPENPTEAAPSGNGEADQARRLSIRAALIHELMEERLEIIEEYELFLREHVEISPAVRDACLVPTDARWTWILRLDNYLDRQIERKMRMLLKLQSLRVQPLAGWRGTERERRTCPNAGEEKILKMQKRTH